MSTSSSSVRRQNVTNPRRTPAHLSVSLVHGRSASSSPASSHSHLRKDDLTCTHSAVRNAEKTSVEGSNDSKHSLDGSSDSRAAFSKKQSSGESSNVDRWFKSSNNHVTAADPSLMDSMYPYTTLSPRIDI